MGSRLLPISEAVVVTLIQPQAQKETFLSSLSLQMPTEKALTGLAPCGKFRNL